MMGRLFDNPWAVLILIILAVVLFGAAKLPGAARGLGQSMRIFKSEVKEMKNEGKPEPYRPAGSPVESREVDAEAGRWNPEGPKGP